MMVFLSVYYMIGAVVMTYFVLDDIEWYQREMARVGFFWMMVALLVVSALAVPVVLWAAVRRCAKWTLALASGHA